ncbi:MAG: hypothetical protein Q7Q73_08420 [Verrucomicrobiota bacterium JB024]|nr:hypothetical protein [Verrucomicrobiota bacterium JB024]
MAFYQEPEGTGREYRTAYLEGIERVLADKQASSHAQREAFFAPDCSSAGAYEASLGPLRAEFVKMLGWPLTDASLRAQPPKLLSETLVAEDETSHITRQQWEVLPGVPLYAMLFLPKTEGPHTLVVSQHGGQGTPEITDGFYRESANYHYMTRRLRQRGFAVLAPQLCLWTPEAGPEKNRPLLDRRFKELNGSLAAFELFGLQRLLDGVLARPDIRSKPLPDGSPAPLGMCGLSYGGFYTLFMTALDTRIRAAVSSCFFNQRYAVSKDFFDWSWQGSGTRFQDEQVAGLVCPRPLYLEVGRNDELFPVDKAEELAPRAAAWWEKLGRGGDFAFRVHEAGHDFDTGDEGLDFLERRLKATPVTPA